MLLIGYSMISILKINSGFLQCKCRKAVSGSTCLILCGKISNKLPLFYELCRRIFVFDISCLTMLLFGGRICEHAVQEMVYLHMYVIFCFLLIGISYLTWIVSVMLTPCLKRWHYFQIMILKDANQYSRISVYDANFCWCVADDFTMSRLICRCLLLTLI